MTQLNDLIQKAVEDFKDDGETDVMAAAEYLYGVIDDEIIKNLCIQELVRRCQKAATVGKGKAVTAGAKPAQMEMFPHLHHGYSIDSEDRVVKDTISLLEKEFDWIIKIREKQIKADKNHVDELRRARRAAKPVWNIHPDWTFGQCCDYLRKQKEKADRSVPTEEGDSPTP